MSTTAEAEAKRYNGWTNYETWVVNLWMDNDEGSQGYWQRIKEELREQAEGDREEARRLLAVEIREQHKEAWLDILGRADATVSVFADLLGGTLGEVNWMEISEHLLEE